MIDAVRSASRSLCFLFALAALAVLSACGEAETSSAPGADNVGGNAAANPNPEDQPSGARPQVGAGGQLEMSQELREAGVTEADLMGAHRPEPDVLHPDGTASPALGGRVIMHLAGEPANMNFLIENSGSVRWMYYDVHAGLLQFDPSTWEYEKDLATDYWVEDSVFRNDGERIWGRIVEESDGAIVLESGSPRHEMERTVVPRADVARVERGTVWTFELRRDARWHDGHGFDADDVMFTMKAFENKAVDCEAKRFKYLDVVAEKLDDYSVRFFRDEQYFGSKGAFGLDYVILPRHLYDLADPDNPDHDPLADVAKQGAYVNENPHNKAFVGLGPYRVTQWQTGQFVEAERFNDYWENDPEKAGYLDQLRWRFIKGDDPSWQALLNEELDLFYRVKTEDFVGQATRSETFTKNFYKALTYTGNLGYTAWNMYREKLSDVRVRTALAHGFDIKGWIASNYEGLALWSTNSQFWFGPAYDHSIPELAYDPERAEDLLADAGWYDRNGDGTVDKDGEELVLSLLMPSGNKASEKFLQALQSAYAAIGVGIEVEPLEWATMLENLYKREFDGVNMMWTLPDPESDPTQLWHSSNGVFEKRSSNRSGLMDARVDELIEAGRRELDEAKRADIFHQLHARLYELQPYLFGWNVPRKIAINRKLHGLRLYKFEPGFRLRDLYYAEGTPGTRPVTR